MLGTVSAVHDISGLSRDLEELQVADAGHPLPSRMIRTGFIITDPMYPQLRRYPGQSQGQRCQEGLWPAQP
jgi:hypothetical protein